MRTTFVVVILAVVSCLFFSCAQKQADLAGLKKTIVEYNAASKASMMGGDMDKPLSYYDTDGLEMPPNMEAAKGKDAIKAMLTKMMSSGAKMTSVDFTPTDIQAGGMVGYEIGTYAMTIDVPKMGTVQDKGKYITLWNQKPDGSWKLRAEMWSSDTPMPSMDKMDSKKK
jgi:ketosteroid isomerase-like protein